MKNPKAAIRYAKSILDLAIEKNQLDEVRKDFALMGSTVASSKELQVLLGSPVVSHDKKASILTAIFGQHVGTIAATFITVLTRKNREGLLPEIIESFDTLYLDYKGIQSATVTSSVSLDAELTQKVTDLAKRISGKDIVLSQKVNEDLIGGFVLRVGDYQLDASVAGKLKAIKNNFDENHYVAEF